jgi:hypothetical protein
MSLYIKEIEDEKKGQEETGLVTITLETYTWLVERSSRLEVAEELVPRGMSLVEAVVGIRPPVPAQEKPELTVPDPEKEPDPSPEELPAPAVISDPEPVREEAPKKEDRCPDVPKLRALLAAGRDVHFIAVEWGVSEEVAEKWIAQAQRKLGRPKKKEAAG